MLKAKNDPYPNGMGRPRVFKSPDQLFDMFTSYLDFCTNNEQLPNIAGFMVHLYSFFKIEIDRPSFYKYQEYKEFSNTIKRINESLEDTTLNNKTQKDLIKLAYLNNRCGYTNKQDINQTVNLQLDDSSIQSRLAAAGYTLIANNTDNED